MSFETDRCQLFCVTWRKANMQPIVLLRITYLTGDGMSAKNVQFTVAAHIMAALGYYHGEEISSATLAGSVSADPTFVRKSLSKLSKAGLVVTKRGKSGASVLARPPRQITLLDIYRASTAPPTFAIHSYPVNKRCPVSCNLRECMSGVLSQAQYSFERSLAKITLANLVGQIREKAH
jgi:Rrf2 family protein